MRPLLFFVIAIFTSLILPFTSFTVSAKNDSNTLVILTTLSEKPLQPILDGFKQKYSSAKVKVIHRRTSTSIKLLNQGYIDDIDVVISTSPFLMNKLNELQLLKAVPSKYNPPAWLAAHIMVDDNRAVAVGYSGAVILWNKDYLAMNKLPQPTRWEDLAKPDFFQHITMSTPTRSGTTQMMIESILQHYGWDEGWRLLLNIGANLATISSRSFGVSESISRGIVGAGPVIDSYALNLTNLSFLSYSYLSNVALMPSLVGVLNTQDQNRLTTQFLDYFLSNSVQSTISSNSFAKQPINDPKLAKNVHFILDKEVMTRREQLINTLFDLAITQQLPQLQDTWLSIIKAQKRYQGRPDIQQQIEQAKSILFHFPINEDEALSAHQKTVRYEGDPKYNPDLLKIQLKWNQKFNLNLSRASQIIIDINKKEHNK
ncbi:ABC transporter substrate-binding protein [Aliivibrio kagoshimensis]|uniref:ABC transporter substrate-binding protein n=1 Tax=Aliivibrio kagoshimensis TaxID=2910230 RepID=UPI003D099BA5